jgi:hypothetical protein
MPKDVFNQLSANLRGSVITPESSEYDAARKVYNGMIDRRPAAIARCADVADVRTAVNFARVIDLSPMKGSGSIRPQRRCGQRRAVLRRI